MRTSFFGRLLLALLPLLVFIPLFIGSRLISRADGWSDWVMVFGSAALVAFNPLVVQAPSWRRRWSFFAAGAFAWAAFLVFLGFAIMAAVFHEGL
jgi:hypothetical protein